MKPARLAPILSALALIVGPSPCLAKDAEAARVGQHIARALQKVLVERDGVARVDANALVALARSTRKQVKGQGPSLSGTCTVRLGDRVRTVAWAVGRVGGDAVAEGEDVTLAIGGDGRATGGAGGTARARGGVLNLAVGGDGGEGARGQEEGCAGGRGGDAEAVPGDARPCWSLALAGNGGSGGQGGLRGGDGGAGGDAALRGSGEGQSGAGGRGASVTVVFRGNATLGGGMVLGGGEHGPFGVVRRLDRPSADEADEEEARREAAEGR
ncbi:MAG: hypothetical protein KF878_11940 [Planctomycetes bacterium]|nr:hypothetical protein [Planctomycetota bacterium]